MRVFEISINLISGMMVGIEIANNPDDGEYVIVLDLLIVRLVFGFVTLEE